MLTGHLGSDQYRDSSFKKSGESWPFEGAAPTTREPVNRRVRCRERENVVLYLEKYVMLKHAIDLSVFCRECLEKRTLR